VPIDSAYDWLKWHVFCVPCTYKQTTFLLKIHCFSVSVGAIFFWRNRVLFVEFTGITFLKISFWGDYKTNFFEENPIFTFFDKSEIFKYLIIFINQIGFSFAGFWRTHSLKVSLGWKCKNTLFFKMGFYLQNLQEFTFWKPVFDKIIEMLFLKKIRYLPFLEMWGFWILDK
jgi:hypothetical protein